MEFDEISAFNPAALSLSLVLEKLRGSCIHRCAVLKCKQTKKRIWLWSSFDSMHDQWPYLTAYSEIKCLSPCLSHGWCSWIAQLVYNMWKEWNMTSQTYRIQRLKLFEREFEFPVNTNDIGYSLLEIWCLTISTCNWKMVKQSKDELQSPENLMVRLTCMTAEFFSCNWILGSPTDICLLEIIAYTCFIFQVYIY